MHLVYVQNKPDDFMQIVSHADSGVNVAGILGDAGCTQKAWWWQGLGCGEGEIFHLKWRILVHSERYFCPCSCQKKMLNVPPEAVIWWTMKMYFWEIVNTVLE